MGRRPRPTYADEGDGELPGIGHNRPELTPEEARAALLESTDPEQLVSFDLELVPDLLAAQYRALVERSDELLAEAQAWINEHLDARGAFVIRDEETNARASEIYRQLQDHAGAKGEVETTRTRVKARPFRLGQIIDTFFKGISSRPSLILGQMDLAQQKWIAFRREEEARLRREAEAAAAAEARRVAAEAAEARAKAQAELDARMAALAEDDSDEAIEAALEAEQQAAEIAQQTEEQRLRAEEEASRAARAARASVPDLTRSYSPMGVSTSGSERWKWELTDIVALARAVADGKVPSNYLTTNSRVIDADVTAKRNPRRQVPGLRIFPDIKVNRRGG